MAAKIDNTTRAFDALKDEYAQGPREFEDNAALIAYINELEVIAQEARDIKAFYKAKLAVLATQRSRQARKAREAELAARVAELEAQIATA